MSFEYVTCQYVCVCVRVCVSSRYDLQITKGNVNSFQMIQMISSWLGKSRLQQNKHHQFCLSVSCLMYSLQHSVILIFIMNTAVHMLQRYVWERPYPVARRNRYPRLLWRNWPSQSPDLNSIQTTWMTGNANWEPGLTAQHERVNSWVLWLKRSKSMHPESKLLGKALPKDWRLL